MTRSVPLIFSASGCFVLDTKFVFLHLCACRGEYARLNDLGRTEALARAQVDDLLPRLRVTANAVLIVPAFQFFRALLYELNDFVRHSLVCP